MANPVIDKSAATAARDAKQQVRDLLDRLPDGLSLEQIRYHLDVVIKVLAAERSADDGHVLSQAEFDQRFAKWLT